MKNLIAFCFFVALCICTSGCISGPYARQGAALGALVGTPVGAVIGSRNGETTAGALLGGTIGALTGSNIGAGVDAERRELLRQQELSQQKFATGGLAMQDIMAMSHSGLGEEVILTQIRNQGINQRLSTPDLIALKQAGVSDRVVQAMQTSPTRDVFPAGSASPSSAPIIVEEHYWDPGRHDPYCDPYHIRLHRHHRPVRPARRASLSFSHRF